MAGNLIAGSAEIAEKNSHNFEVKIDEKSVSYTRVNTVHRLHEGLRLCTPPTTASKTGKLRHRRPCLTVDPKLPGG